MSYPSLGYLSLTAIRYIANQTKEPLRDDVLEFIDALANISEKDAARVMVELTENSIAVIQNGEVTHA